MTIGVEPIILNFFLPWIKKEDDDIIIDKQDKYIRASQVKESEMSSINVAHAESPENDT
jgi:hypothetical protein